MTTPPASLCGPRTENGSECRAPASASKASLTATVTDYVSRVCQDGVDIRRHQTRKVLRGSMQREDLLETRAADREIPAVAPLRAEDGELPLLEAGPPALDRRFDRAVHAGPGRGVEQLRTQYTDRHQA